MRDNRVAILPSTTVNVVNAATTDGNALDLKSGLVGTVDSLGLYGLPVEILISGLTGTGTYTFSWVESDDNSTYVTGAQSSVIGAVAPFPTVNGATATAIKIPTRLRTNRPWAKLRCVTTGTITITYRASVQDGVPHWVANTVQYSA